MNVDPQLKLPSGSSFGFAQSVVKRELVLPLSHFHSHAQTDAPEAATARKNGAGSITLLPGTTGPTSPKITAMPASCST